MLGRGKGQPLKSQPSADKQVRRGRAGKGTAADGLFNIQRTVFNFPSFNYYTENVLLCFCVCILFALYMSLAHRHPYTMKISKGNSRSKSVHELKSYEEGLS